MYRIDPERVVDESLNELAAIIADLANTPKEALALVERLIQRAEQLRQVDWAVHIEEAEQMRARYEAAGNAMKGFILDVDDDDCNDED